MAAVPKRRLSKSRKNKRRSADNKNVVLSQNCPKCGAIKLPHRKCRECGNYK